jgi:hypothetical protein
MSNQTLSYEQSLLRERSRHYLLCYNATCPRKDHCLHWLVGQWASDDTLYATVVNPYRKDVVAGTCTDYCSNAKVKMARGMLNFYENIPEGKAKAIRSDLIATFNKTLYFKWRNGEKPITPEQQAQIASICRANGWTEPPVYDAYYEEYQF